MAGLVGGVLTDQADIGKTDVKGAASYSQELDGYEVNGSGTGLAESSDALHFVYAQVTGDVSISSGIAWGKGSSGGSQGAALMIRQSLSPESPFAAVVARRNGSGVLAYRAGAAAPASEFRIAWKAPSFLTLQRQGNEITIKSGDSMRDSVGGGPVIVSMSGPIYAGVAVYSGKPSEAETVKFNHLRLKNGRAALSPVIDFQLMPEHGGVRLPTL
jgi:hypothetical protein